MDLSAWTNQLWICEPNSLSRAVTRARTHGRCYTREEILAAHRESLEVAKSLADTAVEGIGLDDLRENIIGEWESGRNAKAGSLTIENAHDYGVRAEAPRAIRAVKGKVGVIPVFGPLDQFMSSELMKANGTPTEFIVAAIDSLASNPSVGAIVLRVNSPGGTTFGIQEVSDKIFQARSEKPIYAIADSVAASAGYWLASSASMFIATTGGEVGSIGVYRMHIDESVALEKEGVKVSLVSAGKYKTEGSPFGPLGDETRDNWQARVDETHAKFISTVSRNMDVPIDRVRKEFGEGRVVSAQEALKRGMIHRIATFQQLMNKLTGNNAAQTTPHQAAHQLSAEVLLARHRLRQTKNLSKMA